MEEFIKMLRTELDSRGLNPTQAAKMLGCGRPYLYRVLSGEQSPSFEWAEKVGEKLGIGIYFEKTT